MHLFLEDLRENLFPFLFQLPEATPFLGPFLHPPHLQANNDRLSPSHIVLLWPSLLPLSSTYQTIPILSDYPRIINEGHLIVILNSLCHVTLYSRSFQELRYRHLGWLFYLPQSHPHSKCGSASWLQLLEFVPRIIPFKASISLFVKWEWSS